MDVNESKLELDSNNLKLQPRLFWVVSTILQLDHDRIS